MFACDRSAGYGAKRWRAKREVRPPTTALCTTHAPEDVDVESARSAKLGCAFHC
jgi:hypothetical protein